LVISTEEYNEIITKNLSHSTLYIGYKEKYIEETMNTKFLGLYTDNHKNWRNHVEQMIPKLSEACNAVRSVVYISNTNTLKSIYNAHFHSIIKYGIIFCGNSSYSGNIFTVQKKIVRIMADAKPRTSCRSLFQQFEMLLVPCQLIFSLMNFTINN
jgi:hypothetical protein